MQSKPKLVLIGIDGASHTLIARGLQQGRLPTFRSLAAGRPPQPLLTPFPPHTAPGWTSLFTGVSPGEHGVYQFWELQAPGYRPALSTVADFGREPLWRSLERHGLSVGLFHVPMSHPPEPIADGYMLTWPLTPTLGYAWPRSLIGELAEHGLHYQSDLMTMYREDESYLETARALIDAKVDTLLYLMDARPVDALFAVFTELDRVSHCYWGGEEAPADEVNTIYDHMDAALGRLLAAIDDDVAVLVVSDHGFGVCRHKINVNALLAEAGLLATQRAEAPVAANGRKAHFSDVEQALSASWFRAAAPDREVDFSRTRAFMPAPGCYGITLNRAGRQRQGIVSDTEAGAVIREVEAVLGDLSLDGDRPFEVLPRRQVYRGHRLADAPDLILMPGRWDAMPAPDLQGPVFDAPAQAGIHREDGILFARGLVLESRAARVEDVAPTVLVHLGLPAQADLDGRSLALDAPRIACEPAQRLARSPASAAIGAHQVEIERRLAQLGYL